jgi:outer membrane immunogenic protein
MKDFFWGALAGALLGFCAHADAADMAASINKAPVASAPYGDPWSGFYIGGAVGYGWIRGTGTFSESEASSSFGTSPQGLVGGLHLGTGTRIGGNVYVGAEVAGGVGTLDGTAQNPGFIGNANSKNHWLMSVSGRLGYIVAPNAMVYARGGWAWAGSEFTLNSGPLSISTSPTLNGGLLAGGIEVALTPNWIAGLEYQHYFLNDINLPIAVGLSARVNDNIDVALARLSYKF